MLKIVLHPVSLSSFDDPETATLYLNYEEAIQIINEDLLLERVTGQTEEVRKKLRYLVSKPNLLADYISLNKDSLAFEVYPAEVLNKINLIRGVIIKGYGTDESTD